jgi:hypothetical protein
VLSSFLTKRRPRQQVPELLVVHFKELRRHLVGPSACILLDPLEQVGGGPLDHPSTTLASFPGAHSTALHRVRLPRLGRPVRAHGGVPAVEHGPDQRPHDAAVQLRGCRTFVEHLVKHKGVTGDTVSAGASPLEMMASMPASHERQRREERRHVLHHHHRHPPRALAVETGWIFHARPSLLELLVFPLPFDDDDDCCGCGSGASTGRTRIATVPRNKETGTV